MLFFASPAYPSDPIRLDKKLERIVKQYSKENECYSSWKTPPKRKRASKELVDGQQKEVIYEQDDRPLEKFWHWKVTLLPGKEPVMVRVV